jgi:hypothetical protein
VVGQAALCGPHRIEDLAGSVGLAKIGAVGDRLGASVGRRVALSGEEDDTDLEDRDQLLGEFNAIVTAT